MPSVALDPELTALAASVWPGANVVHVPATGVWYLYDSGWMELGRSGKEARAKLDEMIGASERREPMRVLRSPK